MGDKSYDAIVAGGGHHGLIMACYLQRAGMKTGVSLNFSLNWEEQSPVKGARCRDFV